MLRNIFLAAICTTLCSVPWAFAAPRINEIMATGQTVIQDEDHAYSDWLEIYNPDATPVDLGGWHLSDNAGKPTKWTLPAITLPPGGAKVIFASRKNRKPATGNLHTNFSLDGAGGVLLLTRPDASVAQTFSYPAQIPDISWDGVNFLSNPTPGAANNPAVEPITQAPQFSQARGFQSAAFNLSMTSGTPGSAIYYTLDGTEPGPASTQYTAPIRITSTTVVRAIAISPGNDASPLTARTFLFPSDIVKQSPNGAAPKGWPSSWGANKVDYGMDPDITAKAPYNATIKDDLRAVPTFSVVMSLDDLFNADTGIYANTFSKGREWERPMSLEYIEPTGGGGFQIGAGIRIRGGASRDSGNPKHSLQFRFRKEYGAAHLDYPLFGEDGPVRTDAFDLRWDHLVSWHYSNSANAHQLQDIFGRDSQLAASGVAKRGILTNLYLNGQYWGLYFIDERVNGDYGANHFGGAPEDYDVIRYDAESGSTGLADGSRRAWREAYDLGAAGFDNNARYFRALGRNPDGSRNPGFERLIDEENLIDYMLVGIWCGATDNPVVNGTDNNWTTIRSRKGDFGYRFFVHDFELSLFDVDGDFIGANPEQNELLSRDADSINPWHFWMAMRMNAEFRMKVADRVQKHFFNGGALTSEACVARWNARMQEMDRAIVAESARWGDSDAGFGGPILGGNAAKIRPPDDGGIIIDPGPGPRPGGGGEGHRAYTRLDWLQGATTARDGYIALRSEKMLVHLKNGGLYPSIPAPEVAPFGGTLAVGGTVDITNPNGTGTIYYTLNGGDPRLVGGAVSAEALTFTGAFSLARKTTLRTRVKDGDNWSALVEVEFVPGLDFSGLRVTEIHYNPAVDGASAVDDAEFLELKNTGTSTLELGGCTFSEGVTFTFPPDTTLSPGAFYVIARNATVFSQKHPTVTPDGIFTGKLSDDGEPLTLRTASGSQIFSLIFDDEGSWPAAPDGFGPSLVYDGTGDPDNGKNWRASSQNGGSPGADDPALPRFPKVVVNEVLGSGATPFVELYNPGPAAADISGWRLGNDRALPPAKIFDAGTVIPAGGFLVVRPVNGLPPLDAAGGSVFIYSVPAGYAHECRYAPLESGLATARHINADGEERFVAMTPTPDAANGVPLERSPLRISEIYYASVDHPGLDFVEIENTGPSAIQLDGKRLSGMNFIFPAGTNLGAAQRIIVTHAAVAAFRAVFPADGTVVLGSSTGDLQDNGELVALEEPIAGSNPVAWRTLDAARYNDRFPWPVSAAGADDSLHRLPVVYGDESTSWAAGTPSPGGAAVDGRPRVALTSPGDQLVVSTGANVTIAATAFDVDGTVQKVEFFVDGRVIGEDDSAPYELVWTSTPGVHDIGARATDATGNTGDAIPVTLFSNGSQTNDGGSGLKAEYFANPDLAGDPLVTTRVDSINGDWSEVSPAPGIPRRGFSARFTGKLLPRASGFHNLTFRAAGGMRLILDGQTVLDSWAEPPPESGSFAAYREHGVELTSGVPVEIVVEYFDSDSHGYLSFSWFEPSSFRESAVPQSQLFLPEQDIAAFGISTPSLLQTRRLGQRVRVALGTTRGVSPVVWRLADGELPDGVVLNPAGALSGATTKGGKFLFVLEAVDSSGAKVSRAFSMLVTTPASQGVGPVVKITRPAQGDVASSNSIAAAGTLASSAPVLSLEYSLNKGPRHPMPVAATWALSLGRIRGLVPGDNTLRVFAVDENGVEGSSSEVKFRYRYRAGLDVTVNGAGSVSDGFLGTTMRYVGDSYVVSAKPAPGWLFDHWEPNFERQPRLTFTMEEDKTLTAVFLQNPFIPFAGRYVGIIAEGTKRGRYELNLSKSGAFTFGLFVGGEKVVQSGVIPPTGTYETFPTPSENLPGYIGISLRADSNEIVVSTQYFGFDKFETFDSTARRAVWSRNCPATGTWTLFIPSPSVDSPGNGYASMRISRSGRVTLRGKTNDASPISAGLFVAENLTIPFSAPAVGGGIAGDLSYSAQRGKRLGGELYWATTAGETVLNPDGAPYKAPAPGSPAISLKNGDATFADVDAAFTVTMPTRLAASNTFVFAQPGEALPALLVDSATGLVSGSFIHPDSKKRVQIRGIVNQLTNSALGVILGDSVGGMSIQPHIDR